MGWDCFGHMTVASIAYRKLDPTTRARVDALLKMNPYFTDPAKWPKLIPSGTTAADRSRYIFMLAATWPDEIKSDSKYHNDGSENGDVPDGPRRTGIQAMTISIGTNTGISLTRHSARTGLMSPH